MIAGRTRRFIEKAIICWNYLYLPQKIADEKDNSRRDELVDIIKHDLSSLGSTSTYTANTVLSNEKLKDSIGLDVAKLLKLKV